MGMYDMINDEQVKCFPVVYLYNGIPAYSMGSLNSYHVGDVVPYRTLYYNYTKDFNVIELNVWRNAFAPYDFILHVIRDGKVICTKTDSADDADFSGANMVINYFGNPINIRSAEEIYECLNGYRKAEAEIETLDETWTRLYAELLQIGRQYVKTEDKNSPEAQRISEKIDQIHQKMREEEKRTKEKRKEITNFLSQRWEGVTESSCIRLGEYVDIIRNNLELQKEEQTPENSERIENRIEISRTAVRNMIDSDKTLLERFFVWHDAKEEEKETIKMLIYPNER